MPQNANPPSYPPLKLLPLSLVLFTTAMWGGNAVATSFVLDDIPSIAVAGGLRFVLAALFMLLWCTLEKSPFRIAKHEIIPIVILGTLLFLQIATFIYGVSKSNSSHAVLLVNTAIFWVLGIEHFVLRIHTLTPRRTAGVLLAFSGTALLAFTSVKSSGQSGVDDPSLLGDLVLFGSAGVLGIKMVYTRHAVKHIQIGTLIFWHDVVAVLLFAAFYFTLERGQPISFGWPAVVALLYQGLVVGGFCFAVQAWLLKRHATAQIAVFGCAAPLFGILLAQIFRNDPLSPWLLVAAVLIAAGIVLVNLNNPN